MSPNTLRALSFYTIMKELQEVIRKSLSLASTGQHAVLATIVRTRGSTYRRPGTRMLIGRDGSFTGFISAGCLEADLYERAKATLESGTPQLISYDTSSAEDIVWGLGLGCNGFLDILLERTDDESVQNKLIFIDRTLQNQETGILATIMKSSTPLVKLGSFLSLTGKEIQGDLRDSPLRTPIEHELRHQKANFKPYHKAFEVNDAEVEVLIEFLQPTIPLLVYGAGPDVLPLAALAKTLGWRVTVLDKRSSEELSNRFPIADQAIQLSNTTVPDNLLLTSRTVALIMTHNYLVDIEILKDLLPSPVQYIGLLGPKRRGEQILKALEEQGRFFSKKQLAKLYFPVGLDIGSETSDEVALSIVSEIQAVTAGRSGGFLRDRNGPIHDSK